MTLATPLILAPNTVYGFDFTSNGSGFVTANFAAPTSSGYAGGTAYSSGANAIPDNLAVLDRGTDRVFHVNLIAATAVPEPSSLIVSGFALALCGWVARSRRNDR
ncbi:MAG: PEP-CTERM sorting domain-containing protein [Pirellulales bacterium]